MIPNILTTLRLVIIPFFAYSMLHMENIWPAITLFLLSGATDIVDGWIARHFNMITDVGKVYDPFVDKLMQITAVICLAVRGTVPMWLIYVVVLKELTMIIAGIVLYAKKIVVHSNWYGKVATVLFYAVILILIVFPDINYIIKMSLLATLVSVLILAAIGYFIRIINPKHNNICEKR